MDVPMSMALFSAAYSAGNTVTHANTHTVNHVVSEVPSVVIQHGGIPLSEFQWIIPVCVAWGVGVAFCIALLVILTSR